MSHELIYIYLRESVTPSAPAYVGSLLRAEMCISPGQSTITHDSHNDDDRSQRFSGKLTIRLPKDLHRDVSRAAQAQGVSLNHFASVALARAVGLETKEYVSPGDRAYAEIWGESLD
jgi:hypothetical protein